MLEYTFILTGIGIIAVESLLIWKVVELTKAITRMTSNFEQTEKMISEKLKNLFNIFSLYMQKEVIGGQVSLNVGKTTIGATIKKTEKEGKNEMLTS